MTKPLKLVYIGLHLMKLKNQDELWTVQEAKSKLSEVIRRAHTKGPQYIGKLNTCVVVSKKQWESQTRPKKSFTVWLVEKTPHGVDLELPDRNDNELRTRPFSDMD